MPGPWIDWGHPPCLVQVQRVEGEYFETLNPTNRWEEGGMSIYYLEHGVGNQLESSLMGCLKTSCPFMACQTSKQPTVFVSSDKASQRSSRAWQREGRRLERPRSGSPATAMDPPDSSVGSTPLYPRASAFSCVEARGGRRRPVPPELTIPAEADEQS